ncbi:MAG: RDD family protein [Solirubrobacteraceae bacterium]|nr:RDD family protein [Patulibacter sp.]
MRIVAVAVSATMSDWIDPYADLRPTVAEPLPGRPSLVIDGRVHLLAPVRSRVIAGLIDVACYRVVMGLLLYGWLWLAALHEARGDDLTGAPLTIAVAYYGFTLAFFGPATFRGGGRSVGKRLVGIRVASADGGPLTLRAMLIREWLFRALPLVALPLHTIPGLLDLLLVAVGVAVVVQAGSEPGVQTFYDRAAGTVVIEDEPQPLRPAAPAAPAGGPR